jgi:hypothetical protein
MEHNLKFFGTHRTYRSLIIHVDPLRRLIVIIFTSPLQNALMVQLRVMCVPDVQVIKRLPPLQLTHVVACTAKHDYESIHESVHRETKPLL